MASSPLARHDFAFSATVLDRPARERPARIRLRLENAGAEAFHYEYATDCPFTRYREAREHRDPRVVVVPESGSGRLSAPGGARDQGGAAPAESGGSAGVLPSDADSAAHLGADLYPGEIVEQTYLVYALPDDPDVPPGTYRFEGEHAVHRGTALNHGYGATLALAFSLSVESDGAFAAEAEPPVVRD